VEKGLAGPELPTKRDYDLVLYGATGFTGKLAASYLARNYAGKIKWAIAGRRGQALEEVRRDLLKTTPDLQVDILIGDSSAPDTLKPIITNTKVIISTVGPFDIYGSPIVGLCATYGTHYCDITGETNWAREMIDRVDDIARTSGAKIVHFCGNDCIPWDLATLKIAQCLKEVGDPELKSVHFYNELNLAPSGGTLATARHSIDTILNSTVNTAALGYDPLLKDMSRNKSQNVMTSRNPKFISYSKEMRRWVGPWPMADVNLNCVRRSNALKGYGKKVEYAEFIVFPGVMAATITMIQYLVLGTSFFCPPLEWFLNKMGVLPDPGQGPSEAQLAKGFLKVSGVGTGVKGSKVHVEMYFPQDTGYVDTARMLVESGMCLVHSNADDDDVVAPGKIRGGGVFTPAVAFGDELFKRLNETGTKWTQPFI